jgi:hypothetical protein
MQKQFEHPKKEYLDTIPFYYSNWFILGLTICLLSMGYLWDAYMSPKTVVTTKVISVSKPSTQNSPRVKFAKIQDVQVGELAIGKNPEVTDSERSTFLPDPEPATWRKLTLEMIKPDGKRLDITLLRPLSWIKESNAQISATIFLDLPEMGAQGLAKVLNIEPCPPIKKGRGNVITGTFHHEAANTIDLYVEGLPKPIGCTDNHPFWSVTRNEFIEAGKLQQGEALQLHNGQTVKVVQILPRPGPERVHNLEVMNEHVYFVTDSGVLVHNACSHFNSNVDGSGRITSVDATISPSNVGTGSSTNPNSRNHANSLNDGDGKVDAGHVIAKILGGGIGNDNIVPMSPTTNRGQLAAFERRIATQVRTTNKDAIISVRLEYSGDHTRPIRIVYTATVDTWTETKTFNN